MYKSNPNAAHNSSNVCTLAGQVSSPVRLSHAAYGQTFCRLELCVPRLSGQSDQLPVTLSRRLLRGYTPQPGELVRVSGQFRSYNLPEGNGSHLTLTVFARCLERLTCLPEQPNAIALDGYLCKPPVYRTTPFAREIADLLLAVNREHHKSDYIPCICWGSVARRAARLPVGQRVRACGRVQSREYDKLLPEGDCIRRRVYEVSLHEVSPLALL